MIRGKKVRLTSCMHEFMCPRPQRVRCLSRRGGGIRQAERRALGLGRPRRHGSKRFRSEVAAMQPTVSKSNCCRLGACESISRIDVLCCRLCGREPTLRYLFRLSVEVREATQQSQPFAPVCGGQLRGAGAGSERERTNKRGLWSQ